MECALNVSSYKQIKQIDDLWGESALLDMPEVQGKLKNIWKQTEHKRLYFGQEFCERLIPTQGETVKALQEAIGRQLEFTLVTPYVTENGLNKLRQLFKYLVVLKPDCEVVVNDWGVLHLIRDYFPSLTPVLGRLLNKIWRDPRIEASMSESKLQLFQTCSLAGTPMHELLDQYGVKRIELDNPPQGLDRELPQWGYKVSLYLPYGCITTGRMCLLGSWGLPTNDKFKATGRQCSRVCQEVWLEMDDLSGQVNKSKDWRIVQKGNTVFYVQSAELLAAGLAQAVHLGIDRIVLQADLVKGGISKDENTRSR